MDAFVAAAQNWEEKEARQQATTSSSSERYFETLNNIKYSCKTFFTSNR